MYYKVLPLLRGVLYNTFCKKELNLNSFSTTRILLFNYRFLFSEKIMLDLLSKYLGKEERHDRL